MNKEREGGAQERRLKHKMTRKKKTIGCVHIYEKLYMYMYTKKLIFYYLKVKLEKKPTKRPAFEFFCLIIREKSAL